MRVLCAEDHEPRPMDTSRHDLTYRCGLCGAMVSEYVVVRALPSEYQSGVGRAMARDFLDAEPYVVIKDDEPHVYFERPSLRG